MLKETRDFDLTSSQRWLEEDKRKKRKEKKGYSDLVSHGTGELVHSGSGLCDFLCGVDHIRGILQRAFASAVTQKTQIVTLLADSSKQAKRKLHRKPAIPQHMLVNPQSEETKET